MRTTSNTISVSSGTSMSQQSLRSEVSSSPPSRTPSRTVLHVTEDDLKMAEAFDLKDEAERISE